ncbi:hypothetical protein Salat_0417800 [Sesamum alatum]|uniref:Uncharacterized protein n=1 Tax=Sesamum alatum TaxID=300844 RepID=A0AAE1Z2Z1_9LAMI|nr:hypothetical protein Salat_0417800 [Sesamum alatum]
MSTEELVKRDEQRNFALYAEHQGAQRRRRGGEDGHRSDADIREFDARILYGLQDLDFARIREVGGYSRRYDACEKITTDRQKAPAKIRGSWGLSTDLLLTCAGS